MEIDSTCNCQRCGQPIVFPVNLDNTEYACPHCGKLTTLQVPRVRAAAPVTAPPADTLSAHGELGGLVLAGYLTAIFFPLVGFIIGIMLLAKNKVPSGLCCIIASVVCSFIYFMIYSQNQ